MDMNLQDFIAAQLIDRKFAPVSAETLEKEITYVTAGNGLFRVKKTPIALFIDQIGETKEKIIGLPEMEAGVQLLIPKIPGKYLIQMLTWYRDVHTKDVTECSSLFFWNHRNVELPTQYSTGEPVKGLTVDGQLIIYIPRQVNSGTLSEFHSDPMVTWLRENTAILSEWHSH